MTRKPFFIIAACLVLSASGLAYAQQRGGQGAPAQRGQGVQQQDRLRDPSRNLDRDSTQTQVYGYQLMTEEERTAYRNKMRNLRTQQEREAFRLEHHQLMRQRAVERGIALPDVPRLAASGRGPRRTFRYEDGARCRHAGRPAANASADPTADRTAHAARTTGATEPTDDTATGPGAEGAGKRQDD